MTMTNLTTNLVTAEVTRNSDDGGEGQLVADSDEEKDVGECYQ
jgi:hypothetical protein